MAKASLVVLILVSLLLAPFLAFSQESNAQTTSTSDDWPMFRHDSAHTGVTISTGPTQPVKLWNYSEGGLDNVFIDSSAAVVDGRVYVGFNYNETDGSGAGVYAFDASTGAKLWNYSTGYAAVYSSPAVWENMVFIGIGYVYAFNALTGDKVWNSTVSGVVYSSPAIDNGVVYVGSINGNVYALNASTGTKIWNYTTGDVVASSPAVSNGVVYVGSDDSNVYALSASTGARIWN
jgi:outer membrane protein assembly factor BamB